MAVPRMNVFVLENLDFEAEEEDEERLETATVAVVVVVVVVVVWLVHIFALGDDV
jgi:hypothetical protein